MKKTEEPVIVRETYRASAAKTWRALTDPVEMKKWFFDNIPGFRPEPGFKTQFLVYSGNRKFTHHWKVTDVVSGKRIAYAWKYLEYPGHAHVTFDLAGDSDTVELTLTMVVLESFPDGIPEFTRESCIGGWNYFLGKALREYLEGP